jgi:hypothetical protein
MGAIEYDDGHVVRTKPSKRPCVCRGDVRCAYHQSKAYHDAGKCWGRGPCPFCNGEPGYDAP